MRRAVLTVVLLLASLVAWPRPPSAAPAGLVTKKSTFDVAQTLDRLESLLRQNGFTIIARVDQRAVAMKGGEHIPPAELLQFSLPAFDAALLKSDRVVGLDLPLKALAWEDTSGRVYLTYPAPDQLAQRFDITNQPVAVQHMAELLDRLTDKALSP
ncbi:MAG TPA: DUF302 domain-containing protein [Alphaproteobacteria bacterium]|nr:DUF302 domain-containing protein [Alphaproteobacteria bacterium]